MPSFFGSLHLLGDRHNHIETSVFFCSFKFGFLGATRSVDVCEHSESGGGIMVSRILPFHYIITVCTYFTMDRGGCF